jgi:hypothetical protein
MSLGSKMRSLGDSTYFLKAAYEPLREIMGDKKYEMKKDPIKGIIVHTDRIEGELLENVNVFLNNDFVSKFKKNYFNHHIEIDWRNLNRFADFVDGNKLLESIPNQCLGDLLTSDGWWIYPAPKLRDNTYGFFSKGTKPSAINNVTHIVVDGDMLGNWGGYWVNCAYVWAYSRKLVYVKLTNYKPIYMLGWFQQCTNLRHVEVDYSLMSSRLGAIYDGCQLDKESVLLLNNLPNTKLTNESDKVLTIGIHVDHQMDEEIIETISNIESKGLNVTVQWNGTPTTQPASIFGLRKPSIYAKLSEIERPDGSKEQNLDWGHYVTNPEEYQEFSSLEEAYEHFGLPNNTEN